VHLYIDDPRDATLIKTSAMIDARNSVSRSKAFQYNDRVTAVFDTITALFIVAMFAVPIFYISSCVSAHKANVPTQQVNALPDQQKIALKTRVQVRDIDHNNDIDCIDYALTYYKLYGPQARLMWHKFGDFNHLFVRIPDGKGGWYDIEPTNYSSDVRENLMSHEWGARFKPHMVKDVTYHYESIRNGTFPWIW
jgi:hypothetical protein